MSLLGRWHLLTPFQDYSPRDIFDHRHYQEPSYEPGNETPLFLDFTDFLQPIERQLKYEPEGSSRSRKSFKFPTIRRNVSRSLLVNFEVIKLLKAFFTKEHLGINFARATSMRRKP